MKYFNKMLLVSCLLLIAACSVAGLNSGEKSILKLVDEKTDLEGMVAVAWSADGKSLATAGDTFKLIYGMQNFYRENSNYFSHQEVEGATISLLALTAVIWPMG